MSDPAEVIRVGIDSSGRAILMTRYMADWWEGVVDELGFRPVITQGAWMARVPGGGAENSKGYHDGGGCLDLRVWDRTGRECDRMVHVTRSRGAGGWRRYTSQGMDEDHFHLVLGSDYGLTDGAAWQWQEYVAGRNGLASRGPDYEWRPDPLVLTPPEDDMAQYADQLEQIIRQGEQARRRDVALRKIVKATADMVEAIADSQQDEAIKRRITKAKNEVLAVLAEEADL